MLHSHSQPNLNKLMAIEEVIITSHTNELSHEEAIAVAKIKEDPTFFFRYAMRFSITKFHKIETNTHFEKKKVLLHSTQNFTLTHLNPRVLSLSNLCNY